MGQTKANLSESGKTPSRRDLFTIATIGHTKYWENSFRICEGILKGPQDLEEFLQKCLVGLGWIKDLDC